MPAKSVQSLLESVMAGILSYLVPEPLPIEACRDDLDPEKRGNNQDEVFDFLSRRRQLRELCLVSRQFYRAAHPCLMHNIAVVSGKQLVLLFTQLWEKPQLRESIRNFTCFVPMGERRHGFEASLGWNDVAPLLPSPSGGHDYRLLRTTGLRLEPVEDGERDREENQYDDIYYLPQRLLTLTVMLASRVEDLFITIPSVKHEGAKKLGDLFKKAARPRSNTDDPCFRRLHTIRIQAINSRGDFVRLNPMSLPTFELAADRPVRKLEFRMDSGQWPIESVHHLILNAEKCEAPHYGGTLSGLKSHNYQPLDASLEDALKPVQEKLASLQVELLNGAAFPGPGSSRPFLNACGFSNLLYLRVDTVVLFGTLTEEMCLRKKLPGSLVELVIIERWASPVLKSLKARATRAVNHDVRLSKMLFSLLAGHPRDLDDLLAVTFRALPPVHSHQVSDLHGILRSQRAIVRMEYQFAMVAVLYSLEWQ
ncbi:hypothetical protein DL764_000020 [Monosporascus ibericus]|uniref:Uncharacterized protein n=1 Tax=Monosporascus ibericus TaxID=155417 RepID=A0A4Q4TYQ4_9PEZI|nr:hypothetical protein DL764_000020 [Monosporascus ibericus]